MPSGNKPLPEPMVTDLSTYGITRPQWVNNNEMAYRRLSIFFDHKAPVLMSACFPKPPPTHPQQAAMMTMPSPSLVPWVTATTNHSATLTELPAALTLWRQSYWPVPQHVTWGCWWGHCLVVGPDGLDSRSGRLQRTAKIQWKKWRHDHVGSNHWPWEMWQ